jgi:hypothetical protein
MGREQGTREQKGRFYLAGKGGFTRILSLGCL